MLPVKGVLSPVCGSPLFSEFSKRCFINSTVFVSFEPSSGLCWVVMALFPVTTIVLAFKNKVVKFAVNLNVYITRP